MMQDGKALQAGTSHYLGTNFAKAQNIQFQNAQGELAYCHTTSWGVSTRLIGGVIMTHGDDDGLRLPPHDRAAPDRDRADAARQARGRRAARLLRVAGEGAEGAPAFARLSTLKQVKSAEKRWNWVRRGAPIIVEIGGRDASGGNVTFMRRDRLRDGDKVVSHTLPRAAFIAEAPALLEEIQGELYAEAKARLDGNIVSDIKSFEELAEYFGSGRSRRRRRRLQRLGARALVAARGREPRSDRRPVEGSEAHNPQRAARAGPVTGKCLFTGEAAKEHVLIARAY